MANLNNQRKKLIKIKNDTLYSYTELAQMIGISHVTLQNFMKGDNISQKRIKDDIDKFLEPLQLKRKK